VRGEQFGHRRASGVRAAGRGGRRLAIMLAGSMAAGIPLS
jgi:hypothetical protein